MSTAFKNKHAGRCAATGVRVEANEGWIVPRADGGWDTLCDSAARAAGHKLVARTVRQTAATGRTLGLNVADTWARLFELNEARYADHSSGADVLPMTDVQLGGFMLDEFPGSTPESRSPGRVRMYRASYNAGKHSFAGRAPKVLSREYGPDGKPVEGRRAAAEVDWERVRRVAREEATAAAERRPRVVVEVNLGPKRAPRVVEAEGRHAKFAEVMRAVAARVPVLLVGPAGSGKTTLARHVAEALELPFTFNSMSEGVSETALLGRVAPNAKGAWEYNESPFVRAYRSGGVHLLDELDASDPNLLVTVNAAIANGVLSVPTAGVEPIKRHERCVLIAAANTYGNGASREYVGRNQLDAATLNRFTMGTIEIDYDRAVEEALVGAIAPEEARRPLLDWAWAVRSAIGSARLRRIMSTRNVEDAAKLLAAGATLQQVRATYLLGWSPDELTKVKNI